MELSDLLVSDVIASDSAFIGEEIPVSWTVKNQGEETTKSSYWYDNVLFSTDENLDDDDRYLNYFYRYNSTALESQGTYDVNTNIYIPTATPGNYYLLFVTDNNNNEIEADETNNVYAHPLEVKFPDIAGNISVNNGSINGVLNTEDIKIDGDYSDFYRIINFNPGDFVTLNLTSSQFNTYLFLFDKNTLQEVKVYDDFGGGTDSELSFIAQENTDYVVQVSGYSYGNNDELGNYTLNVTSGEIPDINLKVTSTNVPNIIRFGENIQISWTVENQGTETTTADRWYDAVYVSEDAIFDESDIYITEESARDDIPLAGGESYTITEDFFLYNNYLSRIGIGNRYLLFVADESDEQVETNETDNVYALEVEFRTPDVDLVLSAANAPVSANLGDTIEVSWTVTNNGKETANADWYDYVYISDDDQLDSSDIWVTSEYISTQTPLDISDSYNITKNIRIPNAVTSGANYLLFATNKSPYNDYGYNSQLETDETNNVKALQINFSASDLIVENATIPESATLGENINLSWTVKNQGDVTANADWYDYVYLSTDDILDFDDRRITSFWAGDNTPLASNTDYIASTNINIPNDINVGNYYLIITTDKSSYGDVYGNQSEIDENNNTLAKQILIDAPDLIVENATAPESAILGESINISWTVKNQGSVNALTGWSDYVYLSADSILDDNDTYIRQFWVGDNIPLAAGASYTFNEAITIPNIALDGNSNFYLLFAADRFNSQGETDETNNLKALQINLSAPDLVINNATAPDSAILGESIEVSWTVKNQGSVTARADWYDSVYISTDAEFDSSDIYLTSYWAGENTPLAAGADYTATQNIIIPNSIGAGSHYLLFITDKYPYNYYYYYDNRQPETDETNNVRSLEINVSAPDLVVDSAIAPESGILGEKINVSWTVKNQGSVTAPSDWYDYVYLSTDDILDANDTYVSGFSAGENTPLAANTDYTVTQDITIPRNFNTGNYYLILLQIEVITITIPTATKEKLTKLIIL